MTVLSYVFHLMVLVHHEIKYIGQNSHIYYDLHHIISRFAGRRCESLIGKPKLFFISACRNDVSNGSQRLGNDKSSDGGGSIGHISSNELERVSPKVIGLADIFEGYSTPYGMV